MNRSFGYILIPLASTILCAPAIAQETGSSSAVQPRRKVAQSLPLPANVQTSATPVMVLPKTVKPIATKTKSQRKRAQSAYPSTHFQKAMYFKQKGDKSRELVELLKATQENPRLTKAFYEQALIFRERGYLKLAQSSLEQALALKPDYHEGRMLLATIQIQQGNVGGAMQQLGQSLGIKVGTRDGDSESADEFPPPTVLQSLHTLLPEKLASGVSHLTVGKTVATRTKAKTDEKSVASDTLSAFGMHIRNPMHLLFPGGAKADEATDKSGDKQSSPIEVSNLDVNTLPALPPEDIKTENTPPEKIKKSRKKTSKKNWFSRFMESIDGTGVESETPPAPPPIVSESSSDKKSTSANVNQSIAATIDDDSPGAAIVRSIPPLKPEPESELAAAQVETFEKPELPNQIIEKVSTLASAAINNINKTAFQLPKLPSADLSIFNTRSTSSAGSPGAAVSYENTPGAKDDTRPSKPQIAPNSDDPWSVRLRYLADHGTGTLKEGEAFMFSEESGEATLFLSDGQTVRRAIYLPRDANEVVKQRRPDILTPDDLLYNLSLLAKLMPRANEQDQAANIVQTQNSSPQSTSKTEPNFSVNDLMGKSQNFWGWMKGALKM